MDLASASLGILVLSLNMKPSWVAIARQSAATGKKS
jgi:hypothetical protein